jgi:hypothetical protein
MSDALAGVLIGGGFSLLVAIVGQVATIIISGRANETARANAEDANKTARANAEDASRVELAKIEAENERLRREHAEPERQHRQSYYHQLITALDSFESAAVSSQTMDEEAFDQWWGVFESLAGGVELFGAESVRTQLAVVQAQLGLMRYALNQVPMREASRRFWLLPSA